MYFWSYLSFAPSRIFAKLLHSNSACPISQRKTFPKLEDLPPNEPLGRQADTESMTQACRKRPLAFAFASSHWVKNSCS